MPTPCLLLPGGGYRPDAGCMRKEREHEGSQGPGLTSGLGGRGPPLGVDRGTNVVNTDAKQTNKHI